MNASEDRISVLLPVHAGVDARHLKESLQSVLHQSRRANEVVIVEDGPLSDKHVEVLDEFERAHDGVMRIRLPTNRGAGVANQTGLEAATGTWIAKVDADDISFGCRFEWQLEHAQRIGADVCGAAMVEFDGHIENVTAHRAGPLTHRSVVARMRINNPINHPTAVYRRSIAMDVGGYPDMRFMQDYVLFARMVHAGAVIVNLPEALVYFRAGEDLHRRRSARTLVPLEWRLQRELRDVGLVGWPRTLVNFTVRSVYRFLPMPLMGWVHRHVLGSSRPGKSSGPGKMPR